MLESIVLYIYRCTFLLLLFSTFFSKQRVLLELAAIRSLTTFLVGELLVSFAGHSSWVPKSASDDDKWSEGPPFCFLTPCVHVFAVKMGLYMNLRRARAPCSSSSSSSRRKSDKMPRSKFTPARNWGKLDFWNSESLMQPEAEAKINFNLSTVFRANF